MSQESREKLRKEAEAADGKYPEGVKIEPGQMVAGTVVRYAQKDHEKYGAAFGLVEKEEDGRRSTVWAYQTALKRQIAEADAWRVRRDQAVRRTAPRARVAGVSSSTARERLRFRTLRSSDEAESRRLTAERSSAVGTRRRTAVLRQRRRPAVHPRRRVLPSEGP